MVVQGSWVVGKNSLSAVPRIFLWCWSVEVDSHHTLVFLLYQGSARFSLLLECLTLELCTHVSKKRGDSKRGRRLQPQTLSRRHTRGPVGDSAMFASMAATVLTQSGGHSGKPLHCFCVYVRHSEPYIIYAAPQMRAFSG